MIQNKEVVVITGAASGIGWALAQHYAQQGAYLALADIDLDTLKEQTRSMGLKEDQLFIDQVDVSNQQAVNEFATQTIEKLGCPTVVFANAGVAMGDVPFEQLARADFERVMNINFWGVVNTAEAFLPHLKECVLQGGKAQLVHVSSLFAITPCKYASAYTASKFAVDGFTQTLRSEVEDFLKQNNIPLAHFCVQTVYPAGVKTNLSKHAVRADKRSKEFEKQLKTTPEQAAKAIVKGVRKKQHRILVGIETKALSVLMRLMPSWGLYLFNHVFVKKTVH